LLLVNKTSDVPGAPGNDVAHLLDAPRIYPDALPAGLPCAVHRWRQKMASAYGSDSSGGEEGQGDFFQIIPRD